jgi:transcriptional regulator with XRE-family HTH domain
LSPEETAELSGIRAARLARIEKGELSPSLVEIQSVSRALNASMIDVFMESVNLYGGDDNSGRLSPG